MHPPKDNYEQDTEKFEPKEIYFQDFTDSCFAEIPVGCVALLLSTAQTMNML